ncbi:MAG TPA: rhomboid family intramembrane serine protease [Candidatus Acidoferrum sp.]|nr:rhomboid family intramembrane serine protease [Candidatus Acidoferrum sp.]
MNDEPGARRTPSVLDDPSIPGPLDRPTAIALLARADEEFAAGEFRDAARYYSRVVGYEEAAITGAALLGLGNVLFRLDRDDEAEATWEEVLKLPESPATYQAWRQVAATRVRNGDLRGAITAYREADRRAPAADKAEIANRLGWLAKETGDTRGARRQFARGRGGDSMPMLTYLIIAVTVVTTFTAWSAMEGNNAGPIYDALELNKAALASGEYWRLFTVTLVHAPPSFGYIHLATNMYALYLVGPIVEQIYGWPRMLMMYLVAAAAASTASFLFTPESSVGASGAIFGLFGVVFAVSRTHHPMLDRRSRSLIRQVGMLIAINLVIGFSLGGTIDNAAHIGGLVAGLWLGFLLVPSNVPTLASMWQAPTGNPSTGDPRMRNVLQALGVLALVVAIAVGLVVGRRSYQQAGQLSIVSVAGVEVDGRP